MAAFTLAACLDSQHVIDLSAADKPAALNELVDLIAGTPQVADTAALRKAVVERERIMSTGIGLGLALPHVKIAEVVGFISAIGRSREGIDFDALDGKPVHLIVLIAAPQSQHRHFLKVIAHISKLLKSEELRKSLLVAPTSADIYRSLIAAERKALA